MILLVTSSLFTFPVTGVSVKITANKISVLGQIGFFLSCEIVGAEILNLKATYKWTKSNGTDFETQLEIDDISQNTLFFNSVRYSDAGLYMCQVVGISTSESISLRDSFNLTIQSKKNLTTKVSTLYAKMLPL